LQARDYAAVVMEQADLVIAVAYDFVEYAPCFWNARGDKRIVPVDGCPAEVDEHYIVEVGVLGDIRLSLEHIGAGLTPFDLLWAQGARKTIIEGFEAELAGAPSWPLRPQHVIRDLRAVLKPDDLVLCDVGAHKLWMSRMFPCEAPNSCIVSNGFAAMGIAVPGAIAAKLAYPERKVVAVSGDAGFMMNSQEIETALRMKTPFVVLIWNDAEYGLITWHQLRHFGRPSNISFKNPDFVKYA